MSQTILSAKTSRNQVPSLHKEVIPSLKGNILDYGGGKFDKAKEWCEEANQDITLFVYDPYNRSKDHNDEVLKNNFNFILCANVLNVIKDRQVRIDMLKHIKTIANGQKVFFSVYNAIKSKNYVKGIGQQTRDGWQNCQPLSFYVDELAEVFQLVNVKKDYIIAML